MFRISTLIAGCTALIAGNAAFAFNPTTIASQISANTVTIVYEAGSSAMRDEFRASLSKLCQAGTADEYGGDASGGSATVVDNAFDNYNDTSLGINVPYNGPDMRVYSCQLVSSAPAQAPALTPIANGNILVYYRSEGGSAFGIVGSVFATSSQMHLLVNTNCSNTNEWGPTGNGSGPALTATTTTVNGLVFNNWICPVAPSIPNTSDSLTTTGNGWWLPTDSVQGTYTASPNNMAADGLNLGISDEEPAVYTGENYPKNYKTNSGQSFGVGLTATQLGTLTSVANIAQGFAILVNKASGSITKNVTNLSRQTVRGIMTGTYTDWSQTPEGYAAGATTSGATPITICRRDPGSGTQAGASIFFNNEYCGGKSSVESTAAFATPNGTSVLMWATSGDVEDCVSGNTNAIGLRAWEATSKLTSLEQFVNIDNSTPSQANILNGSYPYWYEVNYVKGANYTNGVNPTGSGSNTVANQQALVNSIIQFTADATTSGVITSGADYAFIPNAQDAQGTDNAPVVPNTSSFINLVSRSTAGVGDSCKATPAALN
jgi:hypothetical protein